MTWSEVGLLFLVLVIASFIAGFVETAWEERKRNKEIADD